MTHRVEQCKCVLIEVEVPATCRRLATDAHCSPFTAVASFTSSYHTMSELCMPHTYEIISSWRVGKKLISAIPSKRRGIEETCTAHARASSCGNKEKNKKNRRIGIYILPGTHRHILTLIVLRCSAHTQPAAGAYRLEHHGHSPCVRVFGRDGKRERIDDVRALSFLFGSGHARTVFKLKAAESSLVCAPVAAEAPCTTHRQRSWSSIPLAPAATEAPAITEAGVEAEIHSSRH